VKEMPGGSGVLLILEIVGAEIYYYGFFAVIPACSVMALLKQWRQIGS
jgi:hypothetical protein